MDNSEFAKIYEELRAVDIKAFDEKELERGARDVGVIQKKYEIAPGMKNELTWHKWYLNNIKIGPQHRYVLEKRIRELTNE